MKLILISLSYLLIQVNCYETKKNSTLILSHIIFRHGDRTPDPVLNSDFSNLFKEEDFFPYGLGQLNMKGRRRMYKVGRDIRERYKYFLGNIYYHGMIEATTSILERTQTSLQLFLAGLFPVTKSNALPGGLRWQPIPYKILELKKDNLLLSIIGVCKHVTYNVPLKNDSSLKNMIVDAISKNIGLNVSFEIQIPQFEDLLLTQINNGMDIPNWAKSLFPVPLTHIAQKSYGDVINSNLPILSGPLLKKILNDTLNRINVTLQYPKKLYIYSGHDVNIIGLLVAIGNWKNIRVKCGSYIIFEVHEINNDIGFKVYYYNYETYRPKLLLIKGCGKFCPLEQFQKIVDNTYEGYLCTRNT